VDYYLPSAASTPVTIEILDTKGGVIRRYASSDPVEPPADTASVPWYWIRPPQLLSTAAGMHRIAWDLHYTPAPGVGTSYPIAAVYRNTPPAATSPWVMPGQYTVRLTVNGRSMTQPLTVRMDPRVKTPLAELEQQFALSKDLYDGAVAANAALEELHAFRKTSTPDLGAKAAELEGEESEGFEYSLPRPIGAERETLNSIAHSMLSLMHILQSADVAPTEQLVTATADRLRALEEVLGRWKGLQGEAKR
jgi:hypothetical protein